jgi:hypothetical protein
MEIGSSFMGQVRKVSIAIHDKTTKTRPGVEDKAAKNILDDIFIWGGCKIEARRKQNHNESLCLGVT